MADQEEEELKLALRLSMQTEPQERKRSKPGENSPAVAEEPREESQVMRNRRMQRELMAAAAEKRMMAAKSAAVAEVAAAAPVKKVEETGGEERSGGGGFVAAAEGSKNVNLVKCRNRTGNVGKELSAEDARQLFLIIFGRGVAKDILSQWSNQGIRFSPDPETSMGLVQHEGGPCGVLATIQAFVLKYLLFNPEESDYAARSMQKNKDSRRSSESECVAADIFYSLTQDTKSRALVRSICEILFLCGNNETAVIASIDVLHGDDVESSEDSLEDDVISKVLDGFAIESWLDLQKALRVEAFTSKTSAVQRLEEMLPVFRSRMGAILFLISALLSRGLESVQADRDDPTQPLVTAPFGHASQLNSILDQEIVNLLLSGKAVANLFDGRMDLGGGMFVKGISSTVDVGFLTLLESLNFCKVGQYLKCPKWPIWVVGSESHYTVLFALDMKVQDENEFESRETKIRRAFDAQDQSGGGGFISVESFHQVLRETGIKLPAEKVGNLCNTDFIVWSEFWQALLDLDTSLGGLKDSTGLMGKKLFDLYHFNGIAKSVNNGSQAVCGNEYPIQRPRLTKLRVSVPPRWTPEEFMGDVAVTSNSVRNETSRNEAAIEVSKPEPSQHAPLVDCIRTRWPRATCNWDGDAPSIV